MKIGIVIPSETFLTSAGVRIRYERFKECLADSNVEIDYITLQQLLDLKSVKYDALTFVKTFEINALLHARRFSRAGVTIGQDIFDDYFSQFDDPRLRRFRNWLGYMAPVTDFLLCSTARVARVVESYVPGVTAAVLDDPVSGFDPFMLAELTQRKVAHALATRTLSVAWFGIGDNPYFRVGIADLASSAGVLAELQDKGWNVSLRIITNRRPFGGDGAHVLRSLTVPWEVVEWTEEVETRELRDAFLAIVPVSCQSFSRAKSLNRAITALNAGCQVLNVGFPLYAPLSKLVYFSVAELLQDLEEGRCRINEQSIAAIFDSFREHANVFEAAHKLQATIADACEEPKIRPSSQITCLVHGEGSKIEGHKIIAQFFSAQKGGERAGVTVGTPFANPNWNYDLRFVHSGNRIVPFLSAAIAKDLGFDCRELAQSTIRGHDYYKIDERHFKTVLPMVLTLQVRGQTVPPVVYATIMEAIAQVCRELFATDDIIFSESAHRMNGPGALLGRDAASRVSDSGRPEPKDNQKSQLPREKVVP